MRFIKLIHILYSVIIVSSHDNTLHNVSKVIFQDDKPVAIEF